MKLAFVIISIIFAVTAENLCTPGAFFKLNCNTCTCSSDGKSATCTDMACPLEMKTAAYSATIKSERVCTPLSQFKNYCNTCACSDDGLSYICTRMYCDEDIWNQDGTTKVLTASRNDVQSDSKRICSPNTQFQESCNTCLCSNDGTTKTCTMMSCNDEVENFASAKICEPGKAYSPDGCNTCVCNKYGTGSACTLKLCFSNLRKAFRTKESRNWGPAYTQGDACTPGKLFYSECNQCVCTEDGNSAFCTFMSC